MADRVRKQIAPLMLVLLGAAVCARCSSPTSRTDEPGTGGTGGSEPSADGGTIPAPKDAASARDSSGNGPPDGPFDNKSADPVNRPPTPAPDSSVDAGAPAEGDPPPERPLMIHRTAPQLYTIKFKPSDADPAASANNDLQTAVVDTRVSPSRGKLVVALSGVGSAPGPIGVMSFAGGLGFHGFAIAYENNFNPSLQNDPNAFGDSRFEEFDGTDRTKSVTVNRPDCVEVRVTKALAYLQTKNPAGDWAYYLDKNGQVRWSDVIFIGHSHGATSAAAYAKIRRVWRAISLSGPRDTNPVVATWLALPSLTPIDRFYGFTGTADPQYPDHLKAMELLGYLGAVVDVSQASPPYSGSHRLKYPGDHGASADCGKYAAPCKYFLTNP